MTDNETIKLFCTEWLLQNECSHGNSCIFIHANMRDITLREDLTEEEMFVKGSYNHGWHKKFKNRRKRPTVYFNMKQNSDQDSQRYVARSNQKVNKHNEVNVPSTSTHQAASNVPSSSTGAFKKVFNKNKKYPRHTFTSAASESEDENSKNLPNLQHSKNNNWINSCEFVSKNVKNFMNSNNEKNSKCDNNLEEAANNFASKVEKEDGKLASTVSDSQEKVCGICFETVMQKSPFERRFGILPNCNHCFCLACIRKWRQVKQFENNIIRACPECRVTSDFVCPSTYWVETESAKEKLINNYKQVLSKKDCKYFKKGKGSCPFGNKCFYLHSLNNGTKIDVGPPPSLRYGNDLPDGMDLLQKLLLFEYYENDFLTYSDLEDFDEDDDDDDGHEEYLLEMFCDSDDDFFFF